MNYFVSENKLDETMKKTAWSKARGDVEAICRELGWEEIPIISRLTGRSDAGVFGKLRMHTVMRTVWNERLSVLKDGDLVLLQIPAINNCLYLGEILARLKRRGVMIVALIHDLEILRMGSDRRIGLRTRLRMWLEEKTVLAACEKIIVHNERMRKYLSELGIDRNEMICLGIFDYLTDCQIETAADSCGSFARKDTLIVAGNLHPDKAGYIYNMPVSVNINLYGVFYQETGLPNMHYRGSFLPEELPRKLEGGFGLVWDGTSSQTCAGVYGEYLRYNNPHKTSLYLASGIPVVIWAEAALAQFVTEQGVGIAVDSMEQARERILSMTQEEYDGICQNARNIGKKLREGGYLKAALEQVTGV